MKPSDIVQKTSVQMHKVATERFDELNKIINSTKKEPKNGIIELQDMKLILGNLGNKAKINPLTQSVLTNNDLVLQKLNGKKDASDYKRDDFINLISGENIKDILFDKNLIEKRNYIEDLCDLFYILGGTKQGITKDTLKNNLLKFYSLNESPEEFLNGDITPGEVASSNAIDESEEICQLLASQKDIITIQDFIHIMISEAGINELDVDQLILNDQ